MEILVENCLLLVLCCVIFTGSAVEALSYDYSASIECLPEPHKPQYRGGIIINPEFNDGLIGWSTFGKGKIEERTSKGGNKFSVAHTRNEPYASLSQKLYLQKEMLYTFSAWVQISKGSELVTAVFKTASGFIHAGTVVAESGCWSMLKGGLTVDFSGPAELYFESKNTSLEIWVDSVSLQPFTKDQWRAHQVQSTDKARKKKVRFQALDAKGKPLAGATISLKQTRSGFPFGCAISKAILSNTAYQNWFTSRFTVTSFENEMKWYSTESNPGKEDYSVPDAMLAFAKQHQIVVRGHNVFWDDPNQQPYWVKSLPHDQLQGATANRMNSVMSRYAGQVIAWDVVNENLHFSFFEDKLGSDASGKFYQRAMQLDHTGTMFLNDYNTIEQSGDHESAPTNYLKKLKEIQSYIGNNVPIGIGLEGHFNTPNIPYMRASLDTLAATKMPIWLTEVDVATDPHQAQYLNEVLMEGHSHPGIQGIVMWASWRPEGCYRMCLTDNNFKNLPTGDVVDKLIGGWRATPSEGMTDRNGFFDTSLFHGDYDVTVTHPFMNSSSISSLTVATGNLQETTLHVKVQ